LQEIKKNTVQKEHFVSYFGIYNGEINKRLTHVTQGYLKESGIAGLSPNKMLKVITGFI
jgi:hypothetical protein